MADYQPGHRVRITTGNFAENLYGTYVGPYGAKMARVKVDRDLQQERNLRLTSIRPISAMDRRKHGSLVDGVHVHEDGCYTRDDIAKAGNWRPSSSRHYTMRPLKPEAQQMKDLLNEITEMREGMQRLELKVKKKIKMTDN